MKAPILEMLAAVVLATALPMGTFAQPTDDVIGRVSTKRDDRLRVEIETPGSATPAMGDRVEFKTKAGNFEIDSGRGQIVAVEAGAVWVRITGGRPGIGNTALRLPDRISLEKAAVCRVERPGLHPREGRQDLEIATRRQVGQALQDPHLRQLTGDVAGDR